MSQMPPPLPSVNPYAAPTARVVDVAEVGDIVLAGRGTRLASAIVDGLIVGGLAVLVAILAPALTRGGGRAADGTVAIIFLLFGLIMFALMIVNLVLLYRYGQTIAKRLFKIKIVRVDGSRCGLARIVFLRIVPVALLGMIPFIGALFSLLDPLLIFRDDYRCLHDLIADTVVVNA